MSTLALSGAAVNRPDVSLPPGTTTVAVILAILLLVSALKHLGRALAPIGELIRMALSALMVTVLLLGAIAVLVGVAVLSAGT